MPSTVANSVLEICRAPPLPGQLTGDMSLWIYLCVQSKLHKEKNTVKTLKMMLAVMIDIPETNWSLSVCRSEQSCSFEELASWKWRRDKAWYNEERLWEEWWAWAWTLTASFFTVIFSQHLWVLIRLFLMLLFLMMERACSPTKGKSSRDLQNTAKGQQQEWLQVHIIQLAKKD